MLVAAQIRRNDYAGPRGAMPTHESIHIYIWVYAGIYTYMCIPTCVYICIFVAKLFIRLLCRGMWCTRVAAQESLHTSRPAQEWPHKSGRTRDFAIIILIIIIGFSNDYH